jgi:hypothetical protein
MGNQTIVPGVKLQYVFGAKLDAEIGTKVDTVIGPRVDLTINPLGHMGLIQYFPFSSVITGGLSTALGGKTDFVYGQDTKMIYGPSLKITHGPQGEVKSGKDVAMSFQTKLLLTLPPLLAGVGAFVYGGTNAFERVPELPIITNVATELALGLVAASEVLDERIRAKKTIETAALTLSNARLALGLKLIPDASPTPLESAFIAQDVFALGAGQEKEKAAAPKKEVFVGIKGWKDSSNVILDQLRAPYTVISEYVGKLKKSKGGGGGGEAIELVDNVSMTDGNHFVSASHLQFIAQEPSPIPAALGPNTIVVSAGGTTQEGYVLVNGTQAITLSAGPNALIMVNNMEKGLIVLDPGPVGNLRLQRGPLPLDQVIEMTPTTITIQSPEIILKAAAGMSSITMNPEGITIEGLNIKQLARLQFEVQTMVNKMQALINQVDATLQKLT